MIFFTVLSDDYLAIVTADRDTVSDEYSIEVLDYHQLEWDMTEDINPSRPHKLVFFGDFHLAAVRPRLMESQDWNNYRGDLISILY